MTHKIPSPWNNQICDWESGEKLSSTPIVVKRNSTKSKISIRREGNICFASSYP